MVRVILGLGSNMGDSRAILSQAVASLCQEAQAVSLSSLYRTEPQDYREQEDFYNAVLALDVADDHRPQDFHAYLQGLEDGAGRVRAVEKGPRTLDIDLLLWGDSTICDESLEVPHPRITMRRFVLEPLLELFPEIKAPDGSSYKDHVPGVLNQGIYARYPLAYNGPNIWTNPQWSHQQA